MFDLSRRIHLAGSYVEVIKRVLRREPVLSYGREAFFSTFWREAARSIDASVEEIGDNIFRIAKSKRSTMVQFHYVNIDSYFNWMLVAQKPYICRLLNDNGYPVPAYFEYDIRSVDKAREFMVHHGGDFVVKPRSGAGGGGVTTGIRDYPRLRKASMVAAAHYSQKLMIEQQFSGESYRLLFLNGDLLDAVERTRPTVIGNGTQSIKELIEAENRDRRNPGGQSRSLFQLRADLDCEYFLMDKELTLQTVPPESEVVVVKNVANENSSRDNFSVRQQVHPEYVKLGQHVSSILGATLIGIDVMAKDISTSIRDSGGVINEINIPPGLHYHEMIANPESGTKIGPVILDFLLSGRSIPMSVAINSHLT